MRKCRMDMRESASDPPYIIRFDMICFVFITHIAKNIFGFLFNGGFNFFPPCYPLPMESPYFPDHNVSPTLVIMKENIEEGGGSVANQRDK